MSLPRNGLQMRAPAKINLGLEVIRRRDDGYHDINTVFLAVDCCDEIELLTRDDGAILLQIEGTDALGAGDDNLCVRAARALRERLGDPGLGLEMLLRKHIPMGAGLGGGSSDAAAVLLGAAKLWGREEADHQMLHEIAASLGSDVPFFLKGGIAQASSRGEILHPLDMAVPYPVLLINPGIHVPTPWAYRMVGRTGEREASDLPAILRKNLERPEQLRALIVNDFEPPILTEYPLLAELKERLYATGALFALMSGSGSTMFGLFKTIERAEEAARHFKEHWRAVARPLPSIGSVPL